MVATVIDGRLAAAELRAQLEQEVGHLRAQGVIPGIATVQVGEDYGASLYRDALSRLCGSLGLHFESVALGESATTRAAVEAVRDLNAKPAVSGILILRPLAAGVDESEVAEAIFRLKDIDCAHPANLGRLVLGRRAWPPATPAACLELLERRLASEGREPKVGFAGEEVVVVGRSPAVGKPLAAMLLNRHATITVCHSFTQRAGGLGEVTRRARYVVVAAGVPELIGPQDVAQGATVIDVGINAVFTCPGCGARVAAAKGVCPVCGGDLTEAHSRTVGDVQYDAVAEVAGAITPVPGGVGAVTNVMVARNAVWAARALMEQTQGKGESLWA